MNPLALLLIFRGALVLGHLACICAAVVIVYPVVAVMQTPQSIAQAMKNTLFIIIPTIGIAIMINNSKRFRAAASGAVALLLLFRFIGEFPTRFQLLIAGFGAILNGFLLYPNDIIPILVTSGIGAYLQISGGFTVISIEYLYENAYLSVIRREYASYGYYLSLVIWLALLSFGFYEQRREKVSKNRRDK
jgi:hypothetical protein